MSIVWLYGVGSVLAIMFARRAKKQIARTGGGGKGLATAGAVIGWIGIGLLAVIIVVVAAGG